MPHLHGKNDSTETAPSLEQNSSLQEAEDLPTKEEKKSSYSSRSNGLMSIAEAARAVGEDSKAEDSTSPSSLLKKQAITPSPHGTAVHDSPRTKHGPKLSIYGNTKLFASPIRSKKRLALSEDEKSQDENPNRKQLGEPRNLKYGRKHVLPMAKQANLSSKRNLDNTEVTTPLKKARTSTPESVPKEAGDASPVLKTNAIISPVSSEEKDAESTEAPARGPPYSHHGRPFVPYPPHMPHYPPHHAYGGAYPSPYGPGYPMYMGYPPSPHYMATPPGGAYYPHYRPHPAMVSQYRLQATGVSQRGIQMGKTPPGIKETPGPKSGQSPKTIASASPASVGSKTPSGIATVADWQRSALSAGKPPSANRCVPLTEPIPSKFWGESDKSKDVVLPDFHRLVNFPDYLAKSRSASFTVDGNATPEGKKHCVMCGKLRFCSVSSLVNKSRTPRLDADEAKDQDEDDGTAHIIPRQNKGLCTACDVTVWVVTKDGVEIKWCKGCKNFRPWAAFGDKGSATKCVRCRDRQREKYAMQKETIRQRRYKETSASGKKEESKMSWEDRVAEDKHLAAVNGLRNLIHAATS